MLTYITQKLTTKLTSLYSHFTARVLAYYAFFMRRKKLTGVFFVIMVGIFFIMPNFVHAAWYSFLTDNVSGAIFVLPLVLLYLILLLCLAVLLAGAGLFDIFSDVSRMGLDLTLVKEAWVICRDMANMLFIIGLLAVAFATILDVSGKFKDYHIRSMLPKIIILALVINFSLYVVGVVAGAGDQVMKGMLIVNGDKSIPGLYTAMTKVASHFALPDGEIWTAAKSDGWDLYMNTALSLIVAIIVCGSLGVGFAVAGGMLMIRTFALMFIMAMSPIAFVSYIIPQLKDLVYKKWKDALIKYSFQGPILLFLMLLSLTIASKFFANIENIGVNSASGGTSSIQSLVTKSYSGIFVIVLVYISITVTNKITFYGMDVVEKGMGKWAPSKLMRAGWDRSTKAVQKVPSMTSQVANVIPGVGKLKRGVETGTMDAWRRGTQWAGKNIPGMRSFAADQRAAIDAGLDEVAKREEYKNYDKDDWAAVATSSTADEKTRAAAIRWLNANGGLDKLKFKDNRQAADVIAAAEKRGVDMKKFISTLPQYAQYTKYYNEKFGKTKNVGGVAVNKSQGEMISEVLHNFGTGNVASGALKDRELAAAIAESGLEGNFKDAEQMVALNEGLGAAASRAGASYKVRAADVSRNGRDLSDPSIRLNAAEQTRLLQEGKASTFENMNPTHINDYITNIGIDNFVNNLPIANLSQIVTTIGSLTDPAGRPIGQNAARRVCDFIRNEEVAYKAGHGGKTYPRGSPLAIRLEKANGTGF